MSTLKLVSSKPAKALWWRLYRENGTAATIWARSLDEAVAVARALGAVRGERAVGMKL